VCGWGVVCCGCLCVCVVVGVCVCVCVVCVSVCLGVCVCALFVCVSVCVSVCLCAVSVHCRHKLKVWYSRYVPRCKVAVLGETRSMIVGLLGHARFAKSTSTTDLHAQEHFQY